MFVAKGDLIKSANEAVNKSDLFMRSTAHTKQVMTQFMVSQFMSQSGKIGESVYFFPPQLNRDSTGCSKLRLLCRRGALMAQLGKTLI